MKIKILIISLLTFLGIGQSQAQLRIGAETGVNLSSVKVKGNHAQIMPTGGITLDYTCNNGVSVITGIHYTMKGANSILADNFRKELMVRLGYLELPVMVGYQIPLAPKINIIPSFGAYFALGINGYGEIGANFAQTGIGNTDGIWDNPFKEFNLKNEAQEKIKPFERFDTGLRFGLSAEVYQFSLSLNYDLGLTNMWDGYPNDQLVSLLKNRSIAISIGYKFNL